MSDEPDFRDPWHEESSASDEGAGPYGLAPAKVSRPQPAAEPRVLPHILIAIGVATAFLMMGYAMGHRSLGTYTFIGVPVITGIAVAFTSRGHGLPLIVMGTSLLASLSFLLIAGLEGIICVLMAMPVLMISMGLGVLVGYLVAMLVIPNYGRIGPLALLVVCMGLLGWQSDAPAAPERLEVRTQMLFPGDLASVRAAVLEPRHIEGDSATLALLGLPVPRACSVAEDGRRVCHFDAGEIRQTYRWAEDGSLHIAIEEVTFSIRPWLNLDSARYDFEAVDGGVLVTRTDVVHSTLRPRWYWQQPEAWAVRQEHDYVLRAMIASMQEAEGGGSQ